MKDLIKSRKFGLAFIGSIKAILVAYLFRDNPDMALTVAGIVAGLFGISVGGQAHADANDEEYGKNRKTKSK